jgi:hypothetical protein
MSNFLTLNCEKEAEFGLKGYKKWPDSASFSFLLLSSRYPKLYLLVNFGQQSNKNELYGAENIVSSKFSKLLVRLLLQIAGILSNMSLKN